MKHLIISSVMNGDWSHFNVLLSVLAIFYGCVFLSVLIDLFFGVRRARRQQIARTSLGYRRSITKLTGYLGLMLMLSIADIAASVVLGTPYFTMIGAIGIVMVEAKSVYENIRQQEKNVEEVRKVLQKLFENKEGIYSFISLLEAQKPEEKR